MSYQPKKSERYSNFGGLNTKTSRYITGPQEVIRLVNYDASVTGSFTKRPDTAQFLGTSFGPVRSLFEFTQIGGASYELISGVSGLFASGASTFRLYYGISLGAAFTGLAYNIGGSRFFMDSEAFVNQAWLANVPTNNGTGTYIRRLLTWANIPGFNLGEGLVNAQMDLVSGYLNSFAATYGNVGSSNYFGTTFGVRYSLAWLNYRDVVGPVYPIGIRRSLSGVSAINSAFIYPPYGASPAVYFDAITNNAKALLMFRENIGLSAAATNADVVGSTTSVFYIPIANWVSGISYLIDDGSPTATYLQGITAVAYRMNDNYPFSLSGGSFTPVNFIDTINGQKRTGWPQYSAVYNNMMFFSGCSLVPSHVFWSQLATPEHVANEDFNEVRTNDADVVRGMIPYNGNLLVGKGKSLHTVNGLDPDSVSFQEVTDQYGFMNNRSSCVFNNQLWFLDGSGKGICQFDGANTAVISVSVEAVFQRINLAAALDEAFMLHVKSRNEVWCGIPVDDSPIVNVIVIYDYVAKEWLTFEGLNASAVMIARGTLNRNALVMGFSNGTIRSLNTSYLGTEAVTTAVRFPFVTNFGWSTTQVYRQLFLDVDPILGATHTFAANFYLNQSNTAALGTTISTSSTQTRRQIDLPGIGLSVELINGSTLPLRINGYTVESRFQRNV